MIIAFCNKKNSISAYIIRSESRKKTEKHLDGSEIWRLYCIRGLSLLAQSVGAEAGHREVGGITNGEHNNYDKQKSTDAQQNNDQDGKSQVSGVISVKALLQVQASQFIAE
jgi:hypothetical protein